MNVPLAIFHDLSKTFRGTDKPALDHISAQILPGVMTGLIGPDGAGKTTLLRTLVGLLHADQGTVTVHGFDVRRQAHAVHGLTGYMPQKFGLYDDLTVRENLRFYADLRNAAGDRGAEKFQSLLRFTDLERFQTRLAGKLSGGMKQKLGLACALIGEPQLLLLDEPSVGVDPISRRELWRMVRELISEGIGVVWSTSYLDEAEKCDTVLVLNEGRILYDGSPKNLLQMVEGRVGQVRGISGQERRKVLMEMLCREDIVDGVIQGENIRLVTRSAVKSIVPETGDWRPVPPRFEDAFMDMLGGAPSGVSMLAEKMETKPDQGQAVIEARNLTKQFGDFIAVKDNSFQIRRGEIFGLLGPNGAGKSTTFKMMCGLLQPTQGQAWVMGLNLKTATSEARSRTGYMAQKFSLYGTLTVLQNLRFFSGLYNLSGSRQKEQIDLMLTIFDLGRYRHMDAGDLPLGFKQRLALACAVMHQPDVLFLDEPTSGVDPITRREFWTHINGMVTKGVTVMVTTHFMDEAEYCDRIGLIYRGENIATGTPGELKALVVRTDEMPDPTLEDAFVSLIRYSDEERERNGELP